MDNVPRPPSPPDPLDSLARQAESDEIRETYLGPMELKNDPTRFKYSQEYLNSRPKNALERSRVTPEEQEDILFHYAATSSIPKTASLAGVGVDKVRAVVFNPEASPLIASLREKMRISVIGKIEETQATLLDALQDPDKLSRASLRDISNVFSEISTTQVALLNAQREALGPSQLAVDPAEVFSGDELEYMAFLRRRVSRGLPASSSSQDPAPAELPHDPMIGHEFIDVAPMEIDPGYEPLPEIKPREYDPFAEESD